MTLGGRRSIVSTQNPKSIAGLWAFSLLWCAFSGGMFYAWAFEAGDIFGSLFTGLFLLIGLAMLWGAIRMTLEYAKFGGVRLTLDELPAVGRRVAASLELPEKAAAAGHVSAELACLRVTYVRKSKGGTSSSTEDEWTESHRIPIRRGARGAAAQMHLDIPAALHPTDLPGGDGASPDIDFDRAYHKWELRVVAEVEGIDLRRTFDVQVLPPAAGAPAAAPGAAGIRARPAHRIAPFLNPVRAMRDGPASRRIVAWIQALVLVVVLIVIGILVIDIATEDDLGPQIDTGASTDDIEAAPEAPRFEPVQR